MEDLYKFYAEKFGPMLEEAVTPDYFTEALRLAEESEGCRRINAPDLTTSLFNEYFSYGNEAIQDVDFFEGERLLIENIDDDCELTDYHAKGVAYGLRFAFFCQFMQAAFQTLVKVGVLNERYRYWKHSDTWSQEFDDSDYIVKDVMCPPESHFSIHVKFDNDSTLNCPQELRELIEGLDVKPNHAYLHTNNNGEAKFCEEAYLRFNGANTETLPDKCHELIHDQFEVSESDFNFHPAGS